jgi:hypothetical protein
MSKRKKRVNAIGGERIIGFRLTDGMGKWLDARAEETQRSVSQILRVIVDRAMAEGWRFGGAPEVKP